MALCQLTIASAQSWQPAFWAGRLGEAETSAATSDADALRGRVLIHWAEDDTRGATQAAEKFLRSGADPAYLELYWYEAANWAWYIGDMQAILRMAAELKNNSHLKHLEASLDDAAAYAHLQLGHTEQARQLWSGLSFGTDWMVIGPFSNTADSGLDTMFPPESPSSGKEPVKGVRGIPLEWRPLQLVNWGSWCQISNFLSDDAEGVYYARTSFTSPAEKEAFLAFEHLSAGKLWLNGELLFRNEEYRDDHGFSPNLRKFPVTLRAGSNDILVKLASDGSTPSAFRMRILERDTLEPVEPGWSAKSIAPAASMATPSDLPIPVVDALAAIDSLPEGPEKQVFLAKWHSDLGYPDKAVASISEAHSRHPDCAWLGWRRYQHLMEAERTSDATTLLSSLLAKPQSIPQLEERRIREISSQEKRLEAARQLAEDAPYSSMALLVAAANCYRADLQVEGFEYLQRVPEVANGTSTLASYVTLLKSLNRGSTALEAVREVLEQRPGDANLLHVAADLAGSLDQSEEALKFLERAVQAGGPQDVLLLKQGAYLLREGDAGRAADTLRNALNLAPQSATAWEYYGDALAQAGEKEKAAEAYRDSLRFHSSDAVRGKLSDVTGELQPLDLVRRLELEPLRAKAEATPSKDPARIILDEGIIVLQKDGSYEQHLRMVFEVRTPEAAEALQVIPRDFDIEHEEVSIHRARVLRPDGLEVDVREHVRQNGFHFPSISQGDFLEIEYTVTGRNHSGLENHFWYNWGFSDEYPFLRNRLTLITPKTRPYRFQAHGNVPEPSTRIEGDWMIREWDAVDVNARPTTNVGVAGNDWGDWLDISTIGEWSEVARWYSELSSQRRTADPSVRKKALELAGHLEDDRDKIQAVVRFLADDLRYQTTPFRNSAFIPTSGSQVLKDGYGDCKDKAALLTAMLSELGIQSRMALVSSRTGGTQAYLPSPRFNHAINIVETSQGPLWVDSTNESLPFDVLPNSLYGVNALVIDDKTADLVVIPPPGVDRDSTEARMTVQLKEDGSGTAALKVVQSGNPASVMRSLFLSLDEEQRNQALKRAAGKIVAGAEADKAGVQGVEDSGQTLDLLYSMTLPQVAKSAGSFVIVKPPWPEILRQAAVLSLMRDLETGAETYPLRGTKDAEIRFELPPGWVPAELPKPVSVESPFGTFELKSTVDSGSVLLHSRQVLTPLRVKLENLPEFLTFLQTVEESLEQVMLFKKD